MDSGTVRARPRRETRLAAREGFFLGALSCAGSCDGRGMDDNETDDTKPPEDAPAAHSDVLLRAAAVAAPTHRLLAARPLAAYERLLEQLTSPLGLAGLGVRERDEPGSVACYTGTRGTASWLATRSSARRPVNGSMISSTLSRLGSSSHAAVRATASASTCTAPSSRGPQAPELFSGAWETLERQGPATSKRRAMSSSKSRRSTSPSKRSWVG